MRSYFVYVMTNLSKTLYVGVTNSLERRVAEHKSKQVPGFTAKYNLTRLAYYEETGQIEDAIAREKVLKGWVRRKKVALIESLNPEWEDLSDGWFEKEDSSLRSE